MRISVVIPCCNAAAYPPKAVRSVVDQGVRDTEIILVDDASTDDTLTVADALGRKNKNIRVIRRPANGGVAQARNAGLDRARAPYVCFLDADDEYGENVFSTCLSFFKKSPHYDAVWFPIQLIEYPRHVPPNRIDAIESTLPSNLIARTQFCRNIGGFAIDARLRGNYAGEDLAFRKALHRWGIVYRLDDIFLHCRVRPGRHRDLFLNSGGYAPDDPEFVHALAPFVSAMRGSRSE
jgi:glycosyltransferase involved in cell wall biosynthesis